MTTIESHDIAPVRSRVSWGAIVAGAVTALAVYLLLGVLGVALGLSATHWVSSGQTLGIGAAVWAIFSVLVSLFLGGWVATQCTAGENRMEAVIYGVLVWGVVFGAMLWLTTTGVRLGFSAILSMASTPALTAAASQMTDDDLRSSGFTDEQIRDMRTQFDRLRQRDVAGDVRNITTDPRAMAAAWWTFGGIALSMLTAVGGAVAGAGPNLVLNRLLLHSRTVGVRQYPTHESVNR